VLAYNDTFIFFFMVDGRLKPGEKGATLLDIANFIADYGSLTQDVDGPINAHNLDGGGSSRAAVLNDSGQPQIINLPSEDRRVINHIGFELDEVPQAAWRPKQPVAVDVYEGEYPVDLANLKPYLCIFRASTQFADRSRREDLRAQDYSDECKALGIKRGMYHFLRPNGIAEQADLFLSVWDKLGGAELRPIVDVEVDPDTAGIGRDVWARHIKTFIDRVQAHTGLSPIIYTSLYYWQFTNNPAWASEYDLWAAWYPFKPDDFPSLPGDRTPQGFRRLAIWQYAEDGRTQGYLANDYNKLEDWLIDELEPPPPPPPPPPPDEEWKGTTLFRIGIWRTPELTPTLRGTLKKGKTRTGVLVEGAGILWLNFGEKKFLPVRKLDGSKEWMTLEKVDPPPSDCPPADTIPVRSLTVKNIHGSQMPIRQYPSGLSDEIGNIPVDGTVTVRDYYIPDPEGFGDKNKKWYPLSDGSGFVNRALLSPVSERLVTDTFYEAGQRTLRFNDDTCLSVPEPFETYTVPADGRFMRAAHDWERPDWNFKPRTRTEAPETVPLWDKPDFYELREDWQKLWDQLIQWASHQSMTGGQLKTAWADITAERKALTDNHGLTHGFTDYILGVFLENNKPMKQKGLVFGGTMLKMRFGSTIFALDPSQPAPELPWLLDRPWLWGWTTQINSDAVSSKWPNLKNFGGWGVPYLILGYEEKNTLKSEHLIELENGQVYSPYARQ
jgi:GH25 family lysozyme M1 (1,4-beta-N-acetylmuramidase)